jgi:hypothetical protein
MTNGLQTEDGVRRVKEMASQLTVSLDDSLTLAAWHPLQLSRQSSEKHDRFPQESPQPTVLRESTGS